MKQVEITVFLAIISIVQTHTLCGTFSMHNYIIIVCWLISYDME